MRLQADLRDKQQTQINPKFAQYTEALTLAEKTAREETRKRNERKEAIKIAAAMKKE